MLFYEKNLLKPFLEKLKMRFSEKNLLKTFLKKSKTQFHEKNLLKTFRDFKKSSNCEKPAATLFAKRGKLRIVKKYSPLIKHHQKYHKKGCPAFYSNGQP